MVERKVILLITSSDWYEAPRLRHQMAKKLLEWYDVIWIQCPSSISPSQINTYKPVPNLTVLQLPKRNRVQELLWDNIPIFHWLENLHLLHTIKKNIPNVSLKNVNMITFQINFVEVLGLVKNGFAIYVCNDPFSSYRKRYYKWLFDRYESKIAKRVDVSLAVSDPLVKQLKKYSPNVKLFLPSHDIDISEEYKKNISDKKTLLYMGFVDKRINFKWLKEIAIKHPEFVIRFIGPVKNINEVVELKKISNVEFYPSVIGEDLHRELLKASVLLLPFKRNNLTVQYMSAPNKLFQYLATGRPIVSCEIPYLVDLPEKCVYQSDSF